MSFTHRELLQAVREAGRGRESFTCADVRKQLGVSTRDRKKLSQFHRSFRSFQAEATDVEKLSNNCYRLRKQTRAESPSAVKPIESPAVSMVDTTTLPEAALRALAPTVSVLGDLDISLLADLEPPAAEAAQPLAVHASALPEPVAEEATQPLAVHASALPEPVAEEATQSLAVHASALPEPIAAEATQPLVACVFPDDAAAPGSDAELETTQAPSARGWRDRAQWLGRRMAQLFGGAGVDAGTAA